MKHTVFQKGRREGVSLGAIMQGYGPHHVCASCSGQIHFVRTKTNGKMMPCDLDLVMGDGKKTLIDHAGVVHRKAGPDVCGYEPHFGSCKKRREAVDVVDSVDSGRREDRTVILCGDEFCLARAEYRCVQQPRFPLPLYLCGNHLSGLPDEQQKLYERMDGDSLNENEKPATRCCGGDSGCGRQQ